MSLSKGIRRLVNSKLNISQQLRKLLIMGAGVVFIDAVSRTREQMVLVSIEQSTSEKCLIVLGLKETFPEENRRGNKKKN